MPLFPSKTAVSSESGEKYAQINVQDVWGQQGIDFFTGGSNMDSYFGQKQQFKNGLMMDLFLWNVAFHFTKR